MCNRREFLFGVLGLGVLQHNSIGSILSQSEYESTGSHLIGGVASTNIVRGSIAVVAASDASAIERAQADYTCDGTADEVQIQAAINSVSAGGVVFLSTGSFYTSATITITTPITLVGSGFNVTGINLRFNGDMVSIGSGSYQTLGGIRDMALDGNKATQTSGSGLNIANNARYLDFNRLIIRNFAEYGIYGNNSNAGAQSWITHSLISGNTLGGIRFAIQYINDNVFAGNGVAQINGTSTDERLISGNHMMDLQTAIGIDIYSSSQYRIVNNYIVDCNMGIRCRGGCHSLTITGNQITGFSSTDAGQIAINIDDAYDAIVVNNIIETKAPYVGLYGIYATRDPGLRTVIDNNIINDSAQALTAKYSVPESTHIGNQWVEDY